MGNFNDFRLQVFRAVAATGSFTKAARHLSVSQPAVSQNISALEKDLGVTLFSRGRTSAELTPEGREFMVYAEKMLCLYDSVSNVYSRNISPGALSPVRIGAGDEICGLVLSKVLPVMFLSEPDFRVVTVAPDAECDVLLTGQPADGLGMPEEGQTVLCRIPNCVIASPRNRYISCVAGPLSKYPAIAVWDGYFKGDTENENRKRRLPVLRNIVMKSDSPRLIAEVVMHSDTIVGVIPVLYMNGEFRSRSIVSLPVSVPFPETDLVCRLSGAFRQSPVASKLVKLMQDALDMA